MYNPPLSLDTSEYLTKILIDIGLIDKINHDQFCELARRACVVYRLNSSCSLDQILDAMKQFLSTPFGAKVLKEL